MVLGLWPGMSVGGAVSSTCVRCSCGRELIGETVGSLCSHQWEALCRTVAGVPALVEHLLLQAEPSPQAGGNGARVRVAASGCLYPPARMAADQIHLLLVHCLESACSTLGIRPKPHSKWASTAVTGAVQAELMPKLESFAQAPDAISLAGQLYRTCEVALARWPIEPAARAISTVRCPACGYLSLLEYPPSQEGGDVSVVCQRISCGLVMTEEDWKRARGWELAVARGAVTDVG